MPPAAEAHADALILGAGVAGLWTLARLRRLGFRALALENRAMGAGQTVASQGIIHGGVKYALTGEPGAASRAIADMPALWRACLEGHGELDLRAVRVLSPAQHLWTTPGVASRLAGVAASKVIRTAVRPVAPAERPPSFDGAPRGVDVYTVEEPVLEPRSLVGALAAGAPVLAYEGPPDFGPERDGRRTVTVRSAGRTLSITAGAIILTAGAGNEALAARLNLGDHPLRQQLRPLRMVMARGPRLPHLYGHCVGLSDKPRLTITSQPLGQETVWWIGGQLAESGVHTPPADLLARARAELAACVPWADLTDLRLAIWDVDRAEGTLDASGTRPDGPMISGVGRTLIAYPTKLAFAPLLATRVIERLGAMGVAPRAGDARGDAGLPAGWPTPPVAPLPWEEAGVAWS